MNKAEEFVSDICHKGFLSLWSFPNPLGKHSKELCDVLVICDPYVIIFSVKHIQIKPSGDVLLDNKRWHKKAIEDSVAQLYGADKFISQVDKIILKNKIDETILPNKSNRKVFRIAVAIGRNEKFDIVQQDFGKGFVHVFDESSVFSIINELDTIADFTEYLLKKEDYVLQSSSGYKREENFLGYYILNNRKFPEINDKTVIFGDGIWDELQNEKLYQNKKEADGISYLWDKIIEEFSRTFHIAPYTNIKTKNELEVALRIMAKESRLSRRILSQTLFEIVSENIPVGSFRARLILSEASFDTIYVFVVGDIKHRDQRRESLELRCFIANYLHRDKVKRVVGIATEPMTSDVITFDFCYEEVFEWNEALINEAISLQNDTGFFRSNNYKTGTTKEYPEHI